MDRVTIQNLYIRICRDSGFKLNYIQAAILTGKVLNISPIEVWCQFSDLKLMEKIAKGEHSTCSRSLTTTPSSPSS